MEATYTVEGIVLTRQVWRESDSRLSIYTREQGKLDLVARGLKKSSSKLAGHLELANRASLMVINGRSLSYVGAARTLDCFYHLKQDLDKLLWVGVWLTNFNRQVEVNQADLKLYALLSHSLTVFNTIRASAIYYQALVNLYIIKLHSLLGAGLDWDSLSLRFPASTLLSIKNLLDQLYLGAPRLTKVQARLINELANTLAN